MFRRSAGSFVALSLVSLWLLPGCGRSVDVAEVTPASDSVVGDTPEVVARSGDWPWWRGPTKNGIAEPQEIPIRWGSGQNVAWSTKLPGRGHSSPTVVGDAVFLATADEQAETQSVVCVDRVTGDLRWQKQIHQGGFPGSSQTHPNGTHANCTIACDGERLFVAFLNHDKIHATALDLQGEQLWQKTLGGFDARFGYAPSPVIYKSVVIFACDNGGGGYLSALDRVNGGTIWTRLRGTASTYASPVVAQVAGRDQLLISGDRKIAAYNPATGAELWDVTGTAGSTCGTVVWDGSYVYASGGYPQSETLCASADGTAKRVWSAKVKCYEQSLLAAKGSIYAFSDRGVVVCWNARTGEENWKRRLSGPVSASPVLVGDKIICANERGSFYVFRADPKQFELLATNRLGSESFATPSVCGGCLYIRVAVRENGSRQEYLYCIAAAENSGTVAEENQ